MSQFGWIPGPPERKELAREALADVLEGWLHAGAAPLTLEAGWLPDPPASVSEAWATVLFAREGAAGAVAGYSQIARSIAHTNEEQLEALAGRGSAAILRLAAAVLIVLDEPIDRDAVLAEAVVACASFVSERRLRHRRHEVERDLDRVIRPHVEGVQAGPAVIEPNPR